MVHGRDVERPKPLPLAFARPVVIAVPVVFLASVHVGYLSGADIRVDGGTIRSVV